jgi:hypothetical protein
MRALTRSIIPCSALALAACASPPDLIAQRLASTPPDAQSYIVGTYAASCQTSRWHDKCLQTFSAVSLACRLSDERSKSQELESIVGPTYSKLSTKFDFVDRAKKENGYHFCIALPPGEYEFYTYGWTNFAGGNVSRYLGDYYQFKIPFSLAPGEVVDVGRLKLMIEYGKWLENPGSLLLSASTPETRLAAQQKCPADIRSRQVRSALLVPRNNASSLVQTEKP